MIEKLIAVLTSIVMFFGSLFTGSTSGSSALAPKEGSKPGVVAEDTTTPAPSTTPAPPTKESEVPIYDQLPEGTRPITEVDHATVRKGEWASAEYPHVSMTFGDYWVAGTIRTPEEVILEAFPDRLLPADLQTWWAGTKCNDLLSGVHFADPSTMTVLKNDLSPHQECTAMEKEIDRQMIELFLAKPQVYLDEEGILYLKTAQGAVAFKPKSQ